MSDLICHIVKMEIPGSFQMLILMMAIGGWLKLELCFLPVRLRLTFLPKEHYGNSHSVRGSNTQPSK